MAPGREAMTDHQAETPERRDEQGLAPRPSYEAFTLASRRTQVVVVLALVGIAAMLAHSVHSRNEERARRAVRRPTAPALTPDQLALDAEREAQQQRRREALARATQEEEQQRRRLLLQRAINDFMDKQPRATRAMPRLRAATSGRRYGPLRPAGMASALGGAGVGSRAPAKRDGDQPSIPPSQEAFLEALTSLGARATRPPVALPPAKESESEAPDHAPTVARFHRAGGGLVLPAGTAIPVTLETHVTTAGPGPVIGLVNHDIYAARPRRARLIPRGARLLGALVTGASFGNERVFIAWDRLQYPDGRTLLLDEPYTTDRDGAGGARDRVNNHWGALYGHALLTSLVSASAQLSQPQSPSAFDNRSAGQDAAASVGQSLAEVTNRVADRNLSRRPELELRAGTRLHVTFREDLVFPRPAL